MILTGISQKLKKSVEKRKKVSINPIHATMLDKLAVTLRNVFRVLDVQCTRRGVHMSFTAMNRLGLVTCKEVERGGVKIFKILIKAI